MDADVDNRSVRCVRQTALQVTEFLKEIGSLRVDEFKKKCGEKFEWSTVFKTPEELKSSATVSIDGRPEDEFIA